MKSKIKWFLVLVILVSCKETSKKSESTSIQNPSINIVSAPDFNADTAFAYIDNQVAFGPRVPSTNAHEKCKYYLFKTLVKNGCSVTEQHFDATTFDNKKHHFTNIIGSIDPENPRRILLAAHWDSRPFADQDENDPEKPIDAANDGGSGVAILLEVARAINASSNKPKVGIDFIMFDGEDYGQPQDSDFPTKEDTWCLGSQFWSKNKHKADYKANFGILFDMVGAKNAHFYMEGTSMNYAESIVRKTWAAAKNIGYENVFVSNSVSGIIDDHLYVNSIAKIPMIDIIEYNGGSFSPSWHTHGDNMSVIDKYTLKAVGQTTLTVIYGE
jgi:glutaminyl-peptide cyclotransferase